MTVSEELLLGKNIVEIRAAIEESGLNFWDEIAKDDFEAFYTAAQRQGMEAIQQFLDAAPNDEARQQMLQSRSCAAFFTACKGPRKNIAIARMLIAAASVENRVNILTTNEDESRLFDSIVAGDFEMLEMVAGYLSGDDLDRLINAQSFLSAALFSLDSVKFLYKAIKDPARKESMLSHQNFAAIGILIGNFGKVETVDYLISLCSDSQLALLADRLRRNLLVIAGGAEEQAFLGNSTTSKEDRLTSFAQRLPLHFLCKVLVSDKEVVIGKISPLTAAEKDSVIKSRADGSFKKEKIKFVNHMILLAHDLVLQCCEAEGLPRTECNLIALISSIAVGSYVRTNAATFAKYNEVAVELLRDPEAKILPAELNIMIMEMSAPLVPLRLLKVEDFGVEGEYNVKKLRGSLIEVNRQLIKLMSDNGLTTMSILERAPDLIDAVRQARLKSQEDGKDDIAGPLPSKAPKASVGSNPISRAEQSLGNGCGV